MSSLDTSHTQPRPQSKDSSPLVALSSPRLGANTWRAGPTGFWNFLSGLPRVRWCSKGGRESRAYRKSVVHVCQVTCVKKPCANSFERTLFA